MSLVAGPPRGETRVVDDARVVQGQRHAGAPIPLPGLDRKGQQLQRDAFREVGLQAEARRRAHQDERGDPRRMRHGESNGGRAALGPGEQRRPRATGRVHDGGHVADTLGKGRGPLVRIPIRQTHSTLVEGDQLGECPQLPEESRERGFPPAQFDM